MDSSEVRDPSVEDNQESSLSWDELKEICNEIETLYFAAEEEDLSTVSRINSIQTTIKSLLSSQQRGASKVIEDLDASLKNTVKANEVKENDLSHAQAMQKVQEQKEKSRGDLNTLKEEQEAQRTNQESLRAKLETTAAEEAHHSKTREQDISRIRHEISLYANITGIKWDYDARNISGHIVTSETARAKRFAFPEDEMSDFDVANNLWDLVDEVHDRPAGTAGAA